MLPLWPRPRADVLVFAREWDVLLARPMERAFASVAHEDWALLRRFDGTKERTALARTWARAAGRGEADCARDLDRFVARFEPWLEDGEASVFPVCDLPEARGDLPRRANLVAGTEIPRRPLFAALNVTLFCNLRCAYCFQDHALHASAHPSIDSLLGVLDELVRAEVPFVSLTGGEPTALPEFPRLLREVKERGLRVPQLITNGTLVDDSLLAALAACPPLEVWVSLESAEAPWLDRLYGQKASGNRALEGARLLAAAGLNVGVSCTVVRGGARHVEGLLDWAEAAGLARFSARGCKAQGGGAHLVPTPEEDESAAMILAARRGRGGGLRIDAYSRAHPRQEFDEQKCGALKLGPVIDPSGNVMPCDWFLDEETFAIGNLFERSLAEVWGSERHLDLYRAWYPPSSGGSCGDCGTNCRAVALRSGQGPLAGLVELKRRPALQT